MPQSLYVCSVASVSLVLATGLPPRMAPFLQIRLSNANYFMQSAGHSKNNIKQAAVQEDC
jgi:hypothetical protein